MWAKATCKNCGHENRFEHPSKPCAVVFFSCAKCWGQTPVNVVISRETRAPRVVEPRKSSSAAAPPPPRARLKGE